MGQSGQIIPTKTWAFAPRDQALSDTTNQFLSWVQQGLSFVLGQGTPLPAPQGVQVASESGGALVSWFEVPGADHYQIFENTTATLPSSPVATVPANPGGQSNSFLRSGLNDNLTRFYAVRAFTFTGIAGAASAFVQLKGATINTTAQGGTTVGFSSSLTTFVPVPGFGASIVSEAGNKVIILIQANIGTSVTGNYVIGIFRNAGTAFNSNTAVELFGPGIFSPTTATNFYQPITWVDPSPASGANFYQIQVLCGTGLILSVFPTSIITLVNI